MNLDNLRFGRVAGILPEKTLVQDTSPPHKYYLLKGGFLDSIIPDDAKVVRFDVSEAEDGTASSWSDRNPIIV